MSVITTKFMGGLGDAICITVKDDVKNLWTVKGYRKHTMKKIIISLQCLDRAKVVNLTMNIIH